MIGRVADEEIAFQALRIALNAAYAKEIDGQAMAAGRSDFQPFRRKAAVWMAAGKFMPGEEKLSRQYLFTGGQALHIPGVLGFPLR